MTIFQQFNDVLQHIMLTIPFYYGHITSIAIIWTTFLLFDIFRLQKHGKQNQRSIRFSDKHMIVVLTSGLIILLLEYTYIYVTRSLPLIEYALFFTFWYIIILIRATEIMYKTFLVINPTSQGIKNNHSLFHTFLP